MHSLSHCAALCEAGSRGGASLELAMEISLTSLGSSHTFRSPHDSTDAASRFCSFRDTMVPPLPSLFWWPPTSRDKGEHDTPSTLIPYLNLKPSQGWANLKAFESKGRRVSPLRPK